MDEAPRNDTWTYDGTGWEDATGCGDAAAHGEAMAYFPAWRGLVRFGACAASSDCVYQDELGYQTVSVFRALPGLS